MLHTAVDAFTSPTRPLISVTPAYEGPIELARALGRPVVLTKLREDYTADVKKLAEEADKAKGGVIYLCNPNNPTVRHGQERATSTGWCPTCPPIRCCWWTRPTSTSARIPT